MLKDAFKKLVGILGLPDDKKKIADEFIAALPDDVSGGKPQDPKPDPAKTLTAEDMQKLIADALNKQAEAFKSEIEKMKAGQQGEKVEQGIKKLIEERRLAPKDEAGIKQAKALLTADYESGMAVLSKVPPIAPEKPETNKQTDDTMKKIILQTEGGRALDSHLLAHVANIPSTIG